MKARLLSRPGLSCSGILCSFASALMPHAMDVTETWMPCAIGPAGSTSVGVIYYLFSGCIHRQTCRALNPAPTFALCYTPGHRGTFAPICFAIP